MPAAHNQVRPGADKGGVGMVPYGSESSYARDFGPNCWLPNSFI